jgi:ATP-dependent Zn protease
MVTDYGMGSPMQSKQLPASDYSMADATRRLVYEEQQFIADQAHRRALAMVSSHRALLEGFARQLLENEVLERIDIERLVAEYEGVQPARRRLEPLAGGTDARVAASERYRGDDPQ